MIYFWWILLVMETVTACLTFDISFRERVPRIIMLQSFVLPLVYGSALFSDVQLKIASVVVFTVITLLAYGNGKIWRSLEQRLSPEGRKASIVALYLCCYLMLEGSNQAWLISKGY